MNRPQRPRGASPAAPKPAWPQDQHSGEGSASALESLRKLEDNRLQPAQPPAPEPEPEDGQAKPDPNP